MAVEALVCPYALCNLPVWDETAFKCKSAFLSSGGHRL